MAFFWKIESFIFRFQLLWNSICLTYPIGKSLFTFTKKKREPKLVYGCRHLAEFTQRYKTGYFERPIDQDLVSSNPLCNHATLQAHTNHVT
jgi:hypothetical protein